MDPGGPARTTGRPPVTSRAELEHVALTLFLERGFELTTVKDIARGAGVSRRTFFRYYASKNDVAWGDFDVHLARFQAHFDAVRPAVPMATALRECILAFNDFSGEELPWLRQRMTLLLRVAALQAHSVLRYAAWCDIVANFVARRTGRGPATLLPQVVARCALGTAIAAYERWLADDRTPLREVLDEALRLWLRAGDVAVVGPAMPATTLPRDGRAVDPAGAGNPVR